MSTCLCKIHICPTIEGEIVLSTYEKQSILNYHGDGLNPSRIASALKVEGTYTTRRTVARLVKRYLQTGSNNSQTRVWETLQTYNGAMMDEIIRDRLAVSIQDAALSQQLQLDPEQTLEKAKARIRQRKAVGQQQKALKALLTSNTADLEQFHSRRRLMPSNRGHRRATQHRGDRSGSPRNKPQHRTCTRCGKEPHPRERSPAKDAVQPVQQERALRSTLPNEADASRSNGEGDNYCFLRPVEISAESFMANNVRAERTQPAVQTGHWC